MTSATQPEPVDGGGNQHFASLQEARDAIERLQRVDYAKLMLIARDLARTRLRGTAVAADDLLQDAIAKTLGGSRHWNRRVTIIKHLARIMESDAGHEVEARVARGTRELRDDDAQEAGPLSDPDTRVAAVRELQGLLALFAEDPAACSVLHLRAKGLSAAEIQRDLALDKVGYDTVLKRIRRRLVKHLAEENK